MLNWIELDAQSLRRNVRAFRERLHGGSLFGAVVKSDAYGHGMIETARLALEAGADWLCVNSLDEGLALRSAGFSVPVLLLGAFEPSRAEEVVAGGFRPGVYLLETLDALGRAAEKASRTVPVHVKLETGTYRQGVTDADLARFVARIRASRWLSLEAAYTHYANIEDTTEHSFAERQRSLFGQMCEAIERDLGRPIPLRHSACSAATILFPQTHAGLVRVGISLYGLWPSRETYASCLSRGESVLELEPVLTWKTRIVQLKQVPEAAYLGYGCTWRATRPTTVAVLPVGYHEGYDRGLSGVAHVLVRGRRAPVRGRVCMNMAMADVTDVPDAALMDEVVLLGRQGEERVSAEQLAAWCGTIPYEIVARIHPGLPRVVVDPATQRP